MDRSEKQRNFVYLRQLENGRESGYARAEMQDRMIGLHIAVQGFSLSADAYAFAVTEEGVVLLGRLMLDARGQGGTSVKMSRQEHRAVQVLLVLVETADGVRIPLAGTPGRSGRVDWEKIKSLAQVALHPERAAQEEEKQMKDDSSVQEETQTEIQMETTLQETNEQASTEHAEKNAEAAAEETDSPESENALYDLAALEEPYKEVERELRRPIVPERRVEMPLLLRNAYWPQQLWPLHDLFERFEEAFPFGKEEDRAYIRIPLDGQYGTVEYYLMGARVRDGWVTAIGYLIPGTAEKNVGITGSVFSDGYWQSWREAEAE